MAEQADDVVLDSARNESRDALLTLYQRVRARVEAALGDDGLARYGLDSPAPRPPMQLRSRVETTIGLLREDPVDLEDGLGDPVSTTTIAEKLEAALAPLASALDGLRREERENEGALTARDRAIEAWMVVYQGVATTLSGLYRLADRHDLASRIRPTARRTSGKDQAPRAADATPTSDASTAPTTSPSGSGAGAV